MLPSFTAKPQHWPHLSSLQLADPEFLKPRAIDMIIGADFYGQIIRPDIRVLSPDAPITQLTIFGWIIIGPITENTSTRAQTYHTLRDPSNQDIQELLTKFWLQEEIREETNQLLSPEEQDCEDHFRGTHSRDSTGRYVVRIPLKSSPTLLGESYRRAYYCLKRMLSKLSRDNDLSTLYTKFMEEYEELNHMRRVHPSSETRAKRSESVVDWLTDGMTLAHEVSASGGLRVLKGDQLAHNQSPSSSETYQPYYLPHHGVLKEESITTKLRVVFNGSSPSSTKISVNDLQHVGAKVQRDISDVLLWTRKHRFLFTTDITKMYRQINVHEEDWNLQRILWIDESNNIVPYQLTTVTYGTRSAPFLAISALIQLVEDEGHKFPLAIEPLIKGRYVDDIFGGSDQLGELTEIAKQVIQLCMAGGFPLAKWHSNNLEFIKNIAPKSIAAQIHSFEESSTKLLGLSWSPSPDQFKFSFKSTCSSSRLSKRVILSETAQLYDPLGFLSPFIVRAKIILQELWLEKLTWDDPVSHQVQSKWESIREELGRDHGSWIKSHPSRWKDFVRNRVSQIQDLTPDCVWRHVPGKDNPADCASRGLTISQLSKHSLWWRGPQWLSSEQESWPDQDQVADGKKLIKERPGQSFTVVTKQENNQWEIIERYSSLSKLLRITAICFRVYQIIKRVPQSSLEYPINPQDLEKANIYWVKSTQAVYFEREIKQLRANQLPPSHAFTRLTAFIDTHGVIRVGGRLEHSQLEREAIHPAILPRSSPFTDLIIADAHQRTLHGGTQATLNLIRQRYWILGGRIPVRSYILRCQRCARLRGRRAEQLMGQLPSSRITPSCPFYVSGVDYAGPVTLKTWKGRGAKKQKGWLCVFVCFISSAVHLEAVTDYSTDSFLAAFRRFTGRRGICHTLYSDCGTTFQGADSSLKSLFSQSTREHQAIAKTLATDSTAWRFNPPAAPHMGGKWEAAVKSVKYHLIRTIGETALTFEELSTLLIQIEAILNSRPLQPLTDDPEDLSVLTPAHFLIGEPLTTVPEPSYLETDHSRLSRWKFIQQRVQFFWAKWSRQYLQRQLSTRKWHHPSNEVQLGSLVLISDEKLPPTKWPLARVIQLHPGKDGLTRVVTLKTATTTLTRPISKLAVLPFPPSTDLSNENHQQNDDGGRNV